MNPGSTAPALLDASLDLLRRLDLPELEAAGLLPRDGAFFSTISYPPNILHPPAAPEDVYRGLAYDAARPVALYVHVPFCPTRCVYCHWAVEIGADDAAKDAYLDRLDEELTLLQRALGVERFKLGSALIGGGTPTNMTPRQVERLMRLVTGRFDVSGRPQITVEIEPTTVLGPQGRERLRALKEAGIRRVSLGVQSFDAGILRGMARAHDGAQAEAAAEAILAEGFEGFNIDLIYGFPGDSLERWARDLERTVSLGVNCYQPYRLRIAPHADNPGAIETWHRRRPAEFPGRDLVYRLKAYNWLFARERGFHEASRDYFVKDRKGGSEYTRSRAGDLQDVLGLGLTAWSSLGDRGAVNAGPALAAYEEPLRRGRLPVGRGQVLSPETFRRRAAILPLRWQSRVEEAAFRRQTGQSLSAALGAPLERLRALGLLELDAAGARLTERGSFFADEAAMSLYLPEHVPASCR